MAYSASLRKAIGDLRLCLAAQGLARQSARFAEHGRHEPDPGAPLVLVACSGGRDSMALAAVSRIVCGMLGLRCGAVTIDHGIAADSAAVAADVVARCRGLGLDPVVSRAVAVDRASATGLEAAARQARYGALVDCARELGAAVVLLAHTRDDQAETVLIGLARSGGLNAIVGMPSAFRRGGVRFARPWLDVTRARTGAMCGELGLRWWDDPTNGDAADPDAPLDASYPLRSRIRHDLIPAMTRCYGHDPTAALAAGAASAALDADCLETAAARIAADVLSGDTLCGDEKDGSNDTGRRVLIDAARLADEHPALRRRVIVEALRRAGASMSSTHVEAIDRLTVDWHGQKPLSLPSGCTVIRKGHVIEVCKDSGHAYR
ncbi:tRNA(Ile)-lysidine synthetase [Bifidobacterium sp. DSM 109958]|uniref:tRNA(Ile)-lysidine synthase n=1 Tax=Bifidobacterium moraviense TaxID=2675323 RepID=A0A7Y0F148_9BIFI|nr:tRNA lysidine(34) synthetase TilS [Bifidobacterium sp. DSM 109958]NMN00093.1 tRNA(Ile)-lysidine synthetase [Bifidobacterium sp. DSM 109958]